jgi:hypothetical protein
MNIFEITFSNNENIIFETKLSLKSITEIFNEHKSLLITTNNGNDTLIFCYNILHIKQR